MTIAQSFSSIMRDPHQFAVSISSLPERPMKWTEDVIAAMPVPIALVGNGPIVGEHGSRIDEFATIIRCNNFRLRGFERYTGIRTTHWCHHGVTDRIEFRVGPFQRFFVNLFAKRRREGIRSNPHIEPNRVVSFAPKCYEWVLAAQCIDYLKIETAFVRDASLLAPIMQFVRFPTTGFLALKLLLEYHERVSVFGFTGLSGGHYYDPKHRHAVRHLPTGGRELELIRASSRVDIFA